MTGRCDGVSVGELDEEPILKIEQAKLFFVRQRRVKLLEARERLMRQSSHCFRAVCSVDPKPHIYKVRTDQCSTVTREKLLKCTVGDSERAFNVGGLIARFQGTDDTPNHGQRVEDLRVSVRSKEICIEGSTALSRLISRLGQTVSELNVVD